MKILIVDDAKETRESLHNIIKVKVNSEYEIMEAEDGLEALGLVDSFQPDIVLTDVLMPKMDGIRFTSIVKSQNETKHIFIAAITGLSGEEQIEKIYASGVDFYIAKPFQLDDIVARLKVITSLISHKSAIPDLKPTVVYNCFNDEHIKHYFTTFSINQESDIFLIFDYFFNQDLNYNSIVLKDFIVLLVKTYRKMDLNSRVFNLIIEESDSYIYITIENASFVVAIESLLDKHSNILEYKTTTKSVSFRIFIAKFIQVTKELKKENTNTYQNELMSATELMIICFEDIEVYVDELKEALLDYKSLCDDDETYNTSLYMILKTLIEQYINLFRKVPEFDRVSIALQSVATLINSSKNKKFTEEKNTQLIKDIEALNTTIEVWIESVIVKQECMDVHYDDHKIMNLCNVIENDFN
jgi:CheY-like chemotaxis protein